MTIGQPVRCRAFVGRRKELAALDEARKALARSSGRCVLISGEAGIGKSRLLNEFLAQTGSRRARHTINTECLQGAQEPLGPIRALIRALLPAVAADDLPKPVARALAQVAPADQPYSAASDVEVPLEKEQLFSALLSFLQMVCVKRATILTIEDIHWADESTLQFLAYLAQRAQAMRLLVLATYRSDELARNEPLLAALSPLFREPNVVQLPLEPLESKELRALIDGALAGRRPLSRDSVEDIEQRSEGNPFFAEELLTDIVGHFEDKPSAQLPLSIRAAIAQRLTALQPDERKTLAYAAVLGQRFDPDVLALVMARERDAIVPALLRARGLNLLVDIEHSRLSCAFRHALTRQTIYDEVPTFEARALHAQILAMLERAADADEHVQELAYHAWESGDPVKTALYNERAGEEALALRALPEALKCMQRVLDASRDIETRARVLEGIGALERLQGHYDRARDAFEAAQALQLDRGDVDRAAVVAGSVLGMRYNMGDETALPNAERFLAEHRDALSAGARNHLLVTCARVAAALYDFALAELLLDQIEDAAALPPAIRQTYLIVQLMRHTFAGDVEQWKRAAAEVDDLLPKLTPEWVVSIETALAVTGTFLGMNDQVARALDRAERVEREWVFRGHRLYRIATLATYLYQRGELARVRACLEEVADHIDVVPALTMAAPAAALFAATVGETALWERLDAGLVTAARGRLTDPDCLLLLGAHAALPARSGATAQAQSDLRAAVGGLPRAAPETMYVLLNAAAILPIEELERVAALAGDATRTKSESAIATDALVRATIASRMGLTAEARTQGEAAAGHYKSLGWPLLEARALELADDLDAARAIYLRCEAFGDLRRLDGGSTRAADDRLASLSTREAEVASLVGRGLRNAQVAAKLNIGIKTVEKHLASVFGKLGVDSRSQVAAFMATGSAGRLADRPHRGS